MRPRGLRDRSAANDAAQPQSGGQSKVRVRSLRDVQAAEAIANRAMPATHAQRFAEIAWLERETERLQREASVLEATRQRIQNRLAETAERRAFLLDLVRNSLLINEQEQAVRSSTAKAKDAEPDHAFTVFSLDY